MPFFKYKNKIVNYIHIPKCGGTSIQNALLENAISLQFSDPFHYKKKVPWSVTSPQHIDHDSFNRLISQDFFDYQFAIIRNPIDRFISAYNHKKAYGELSGYVTLNSFLSTIENSGNHLKFYYDNHFLPITSFINNKTKLFYLEQDLDDVTEWLEDCVGLKIEFGVSNSSSDIEKQKTSNPLKNRLKEFFGTGPISKSMLSEHQQNRIENLYQDDIRLYNALISS